MQGLAGTLKTLLTRTQREPLKAWVSELVA